MLVYDIAKKETFNNLHKWLHEVELHAMEGVFMILVGNKTDLQSERQVSTETGAEWAAMNDMPFIETSAKDISNVSQAFIQLAELVNQHVSEKDKERRAFTLGENGEILTEKPKCVCTWQSSNYGM